MKITIFNGSPWGREGHTHIVAHEFSAGAARAGAEIQNILLTKKKIRICNRCGACFYKTPGKCELKDDMSDLIAKFMASDVVVLATPVYIDNVTTIMKIFIDRLQPVFEPHYEKDPHGECRRQLRFKKYPKLIAISTCAMPEQSHFQVLRLFFKRMARTMHTEVAAQIYRSAAGLLLLSKEDQRFSRTVGEYKNLLQTAGQEFANTGKISAKTTQRLEEPLIGVDEYIRYANSMWDQILAKRRSLSALELS